MYKQNILLAKINETIKEHTEELLLRMEILKACYGKEIESHITCDVEVFWRLLEAAICYHDIGKVFILFQNKIRKNRKDLNMLPVLNRKIKEIRHNILSVVLINIRSVGVEDINLIRIMMQAILSHHNCSEIKDLISTKEKVDVILKEDINKRLEDINNELPHGYRVNQNPSSVYLDFVKEAIDQTNEDYFTYVLLAGLLQKIDYAASAHLEVELDTNECVCNYVYKKYTELREIQKFCEAKRNENLILIGSTGIGKTEASFLWIDVFKGFITLPYRVSLNNIYKRVKNLGYNACGLLHSGALSYLEYMSDELDGVTAETEYSRSRLLSHKLTLTTVDQIFRFVLKPVGYERIYATLAYSKIVIDEIQSYDPELAAIVIMGIKMINDIGGRFLIMSATIPTLYITKLKELGVIEQNYKVNQFICDNKNRHKVAIVKSSILENIGHIIEESKTNKVLIFSNTVKEAKKIYDGLMGAINYCNGSVNLLHSRYIQKDRARLESEIIEFSQSKKVGIWITTNLAEVSLDIDFDRVHTELSTLDSLFQRFGRCNREGLKSIDDINISIYTDASGITNNGSSDGGVYDSELVNLSLELLEEEMENNGVVIDEIAKNRLVEELYSKESIKNTMFYKKFNESLSLLSRIKPYDLDNNQVKNILRRIDTVRVMPICYYKELKDGLLKEYADINREIRIHISEKDTTEVDKLKSKKRKLLREIEDYTLDLPYYYCKYGEASRNKLYKLNIKELSYINVIDCSYDSKKGLLL